METHIDIYTVRLKENVTTGTLVVITTELNEWQGLCCAEQPRLLGNVVTLKKSDLVLGHLF